MTLDLVLRGGTVVDGTGADPVRADVGIAGDRIVAVGTVDSRGRREIDVEGHVVTPGFIDGHTHMDAQVMWDPHGTSSCWHGVTTVVMGNCGFTLAPAQPDERQLVVRNLERAEDISAAAMAEGITWSWETYAEYLDAVDRAPKGINYAGYVGHSALRTWAMGERAFDHEATDDDIGAMEKELTKAMDAGAVGFSTSRSREHETSDDRPVASRLAAWDEVRRLAAVVGQAGGVVELALEPAARAGGDAQIESHQRLYDLAIESGAALTFGLSIPPGCFPLLDLIDRTTAAGGRMFGQSRCKRASTVMSFRNNFPFDRLPGWRDVRSRSVDEQRRLLADTGIRARLVAEAHESDYGRSVGPVSRRPVYEDLHLFDRGLPPYPNVATIAAERGVDPVELIIELGLATDFEQLFVQFFSVDETEDVLETMMRHPNTVMTFSDAGAHVSQVSDGSLCTYLLGHWVRGRQVFTLQEAVRMVTSTPATCWGFSDRGQVREGFAADLNVFDPETVGPRAPELVWDLPGGAKRLTQRSTGFLATVVAGDVVIEQGEHTGRLPGRLLRRGAQTLR
jgi:N-acyl-D-aspartate/D-glutamate deacylase